MSRVYKQTDEWTSIGRCKRSAYYASRDISKYYWVFLYELGVYLEIQPMMCLREIIKFPYEYARVL